MLFKRRVIGVIASIPGSPVDSEVGDSTCVNASSVLAVLLAACFSHDSAPKTAKKRAPKPSVQSDPAYEWNLKNFGPPPMAAPGEAAPAKKATRHRGSKKMAKKKPDRIFSPLAAGAAHSPLPDPNRIQDGCGLIASAIRPRRLAPCR